MEVANEASAMRSVGRIGDLPDRLGAQATGRTGTAALTNSAAKTSAPDSVRAKRWAAAKRSDMVGSFGFCHRIIR